MAEKLLDKLKELWGKITDWWQKFDSKQKTTIVVIGVAIVTAFIVLYAVLTSPNYIVLDTFASTKETGEVKTVLNEAGITTKISDDGLTVKIPKKDQATARVALGTSGITVRAYSLEEALASSLTTTESDKNRKYKLYMESLLENDIVEAFDKISKATVQITIPDNDGTLLSKKEEPTAAIVVRADESFTTENAAALAQFVATALHCTTTNGITILDPQTNMLFYGEDTSSAAGNASTQLGVKSQAETEVNNKVKRALGGTGVFGDIKVAANLVIDFSTTEETEHNYSAPEGQTQGLLGEESYYSSESEGGSGGPPGTDSNTEQTYYYQNNDYSTSTIEEYYKKYLPNEYLRHTSIPAGTVKYGECSLAISSTKYVIVNEDDIKKQGLLQGITWAEYKAANSERRPISIDDEMLSLAADASGVPANKITIVAYEENFFEDHEGLAVDFYDVIQIALILIILALLALVVFRSMRGEKNPETAEELSVEALLQSNPETALDDISVEESSETKKLIEKFVDENPEAAANLLRNWLNEEWG